MNASWDTAEARQDLNWQPVSDVGWILSEIIRVRRISPSALDNENPRPHPDETGCAHTGNRDLAVMAGTR
jgi:hypothetical protein